MAVEGHMGSIDSNGKVTEKPKAFRNKNWSEMNKDEQIEKLKLELIRTQEHIASMSKYLTKLIEHDHMDHRMVVRLANPNEESYGGMSFRVSERLGE